MARTPPAAGRRSSSKIRVVVADERRTYAEALGTTLRRARGIDVAAVVHEGNPVDAIRRESPDVLVVTVDSPGDPVEIIEQIRRTSPGTRVLALADREEFAVRAVRAGAAGVVSKRRPIKDVLSSIRAAHRGESLVAPERPPLRKRRKRRQDATMEERLERLTARETEILQRMAEGVLGGRIAEELGISPNTLRTHVQNILFKLKVHSKLEALVVAIGYGKVRPGRPAS